MVEKKSTAKATAPDIQAVMDELIKDLENSTMHTQQRSGVLARAQTMKGIVYPCLKTIKALFPEATETDQKGRTLDLLNTLLS